jgi:hypothetical protein
MARVNPQEVMPELGGAAKPSVVPRPAPAWPWTAGAAVIAMSLPLLRAASRAEYVMTGALAATLLLFLVAYAVVKRVVRPRLRIWTIAHQALGLVTMGAVIAHAGGRVPPNVAGALHLTFWVATVTGIFGAIAFAVIPPILARLERRGALPEDLSGEAKRLEERTFAELTGKSDLTKTIYARVLRPYATNRLGPFFLAASGRTLGDEGRRLRARIEALVSHASAQPATSLDGKLSALKALVRLAVERRALPAVRLLQAILRGWAPLHVALSAVVLVLLLFHAWLALRYR